MTAPTAIARDLWWLPTSAGNAYLWRTAGGRVVVVDPGLYGDETTVLDALDTIGAEPHHVESIVLTHFHSDHAGAAAALARLTGATVAAGARDAAILRGEAPPSMPVLTGRERPVYEQITAAHPGNMAPPRCPVERDLEHGDDVLGDGSVLVQAAPGHTWGSIALHLPHRAAVLTGDVAFTMPDGRLTLGPFNVDRDRARAAQQRLAALDPEIVGPGHGAPLRHDAGAALAQAADVFADG